MSSSKSCMTREDLVDWLKTHECEQIPIEGMNVTASQIKFYNPKTRRHVYIDTPINDKPVPDYFVVHVCTTLGIEFPQCVSHQEPIFNHLKDKYGKK